MKSYTIRISKQADIDIENLHLYIFEICKSPVTSKRYVEGIFNKIKSLTHSAESYPITSFKSILQYGYNARRINYKKNGNHLYRTSKNGIDTSDYFWCSDF